MLTNGSTFYTYIHLVISFVYQSFKLKYINIYSLNAKPEWFRYSLPQFSPKEPISNFFLRSSYSAKAVLIFLVYTCCLNVRNYILVGRMFQKSGTALYHVRFFLHLSPRQVCSNIYFLILNLFLILNPRL